MAGAFRRYADRGASYADTATTNGAASRPSTIPDQHVTYSVAKRDTDTSCPQSHCIRNRTDAITSTNRFSYRAPVANSNPNIRDDHVVRFGCERTRRG